MPPMGGIYGKRRFVPFHGDIYSDYDKRRRLPPFDGY